MKDIIEILNNDENVKKLMHSAAEVAARQGLTQEEWESFRKNWLVYAALLICPEARKELRRQIWEKLRTTA